MNKYTFQSQPFPVDALVPILGDAVKQAQWNTQAPMPLAVAAALATASLATQGHINVRRPNQTRSMPVSLYTLIIAESGERKTEVMNHFVKPIREFEAHQVAEAEKKMLAYKAAHMVWETELKALKRQLAELIDGD